VTPPRNSEAIALKTGGHFYAEIHETLGVSCRCVNRLLSEGRVRIRADQTA